MIKRFKSEIFNIMGDVHASNVSKATVCSRHLLIHYSHARRQSHTVTVTAPLERLVPPRHAERAPRAHHTPQRAGQGCCCCMLLAGARTRSSRRYVRVCAARARPRLHREACGVGASCRRGAKTATFATVRRDGEAAQSNNRKVLFVRPSGYKVSP